MRSYPAYPRTHVLYLLMDHSFAADAVRARSKIARTQALFTPLLSVAPSWVRCLAWTSEGEYETEIETGGLRR